MYGMVNRGIEDFVVSSAGVDKWNQIKKIADLELPEFLDSSLYNDDTTYKLVESASQVLNIAPEAVLRGFGRHWILYTGREGWASVFDLGGENMVDFLNGLDSMHARVQIALPDAKMPLFSVIEKNGYLELTYRSPRPCLAPMVLGLLDGLAEQFNETWDVSLIESDSCPGCEIFHLKKNNDNPDVVTRDAA
ncbi:MAG: heme NO-binding domain-containing protein [Granulosicoccaceae bacterium]